MSIQYINGRQLAVAAVDCTFQYVILYIIKAGDFRLMIQISLRRASSKPWIDAVLFIVKPRLNHFKQKYTFDTGSKVSNNATDHELVPVDKTRNNVVIVRRLIYNNKLYQTLLLKRPIGT